MRVQLLSHTENPEKVVAIAAKTCYYPGTTEHLWGTSEETQEDFIQKLRGMGHCYDEKTEVLTSKGFLSWKEVTKDTELAVIDPKTRAFIGFEKPKMLFQKEVDEQLITISCRDISLAVTTGHRLYASLSSSVKKRIRPEFSFYVTSEVFSKPMRMSKIAVNLLEGIGSTDGIYALYGFFIGDGHAVRGNRISFHLKKERKISYLINLAVELGLLILVTVSFILLTPVTAGESTFTKATS